MWAEQIGSLVQRHIDERSICAFGMRGRLIPTLTNWSRRCWDWRWILGDGLAGGWSQGSFALGAGDLYSDCDWIVATRAPLTGEQVAALGRLHDEIPTREGHGPHDIEGSYAPFDELASVEHLRRRWLFNDHGHRTLDWSDHCNRGYTRWIVREHGITPGAGSANVHAAGAAGAAAS